MAKWLLFLLFSLCLNGNDTARILAVFPTPSVSHQVVFRPITQELAKRGHQVTVVTPNPAFPKGQSPENLTEIDVHDVTYGSLSRDGYSVGSKDDMTSQWKFVINMVSESFKHQMQQDDVKAILKKKFDLLLIEACVRPALALSHVFKVPTISMSSFGKFVGAEHVIGAPYHPLIYPGVLQQRIYNLTMLEKVNELYKLYKTTKLYENNEHAENVLIQKLFGHDMPPLRKLHDNVDLFFLNEHPMWDNNRPVPPNVVYMAGVYKKPAKELPKDLQEYLDSSQNGVIYVSFGGNVLPSYLPPAQMKVLLKVFSELPYDILFKWDLDKLPGKPKNVKAMKWFPQADILRHPKLKLFITQGGLQSTEEAMNAGVPLIGLPMLGDQWYNVEKYVQYKIGLGLDFETVTEEKLKEAIYTVIHDESYRQNILKLKSLIEDAPQPPLERVMWWIEYVLRHGGAAHLRSPAANMSWAEYFELKLLLTLLATALISVTVFMILVNRIYSFVSKSFLKTSYKHKKP